MNQPPLFRPLRPLPSTPQPFSSLPPPPPSTTAAASAAPDLPTAISTLSSLLHLTQTTLNSLSSLLPPPPLPPSAALIPCPFNPNHLLPPSSLLSHYLSCPSSLTPLDPQPLLQSLHYPQTLHSSSSKKSFTQPLQNPSSTELCFSLENFLNFPQNYFYSNCPGAVVISPSYKYDFSSSSPPMLTLPGFLSAECANFIHDNACLDDKGFDFETIRFLPSEIWAVRNEVEAWVDCPSSYSFRVLRCMLRLWKSNLLCLRTWVMSNSPKYGVVIDSAMRDHVVLLFRICLKAVIREAIVFSDLLFSNKRKDKNVFDCPVLVEVMTWLGSQLAVLYGKLSGKFFALNMLKQCVLDSALSSSFFPLMEKAKELPELKDGKLEGPIGKGGENERNSLVDDCVESSMIFVSQVAAAVAALYERYWLDEKIKILRDTRPLTACQRFVEHEHISKKAQEELQKRSDYRPIIEHDGVLWQGAQNQEQNRIKTREELLAEERDYKRRRMSYRGKKMKRTTTLVCLSRFWKEVYEEKETHPYVMQKQLETVEVYGDPVLDTLRVMRDIIEEFMDEIKKASEHGSAKDSEKAEARAFESSSAHKSSSNTLEWRKSETELKLSRKEQQVNGAHLHSHDAYRSMHSEDKHLEHYKQHKHTSRRHDEKLDDDDGRSIKRARHDGKNYSRSPDRQRSSYHLPRYSRNRGSQDDPEISRGISSRSSDGSLNKSDERKSRQREEDGRNLKPRNRHKSKKHNDMRSDSEFEDRYNPSESHDNYEDDA